MHKGLLVGAVTALALAATGVTDASACSRRGCETYDAPAPVYRYGPPPAYGYGPPGPAYGSGRPHGYGYGYGYGADPAYGFGRGPAYGYGPPAGHGYGPRAPVPYGYGPVDVGARRWRGCNRGYGYAPPAAYDRFAPVVVWVPAP